MTRSRTSLLALVFATFAAPALAGTITFDLPRLTFPDPKPPVSTQGCHSPASLTGAECTQN